MVETIEEGSHLAKKGPFLLEEWCQPIEKMAEIDLLDRAGITLYFGEKTNFRPMGFMEEKEGRRTRPGLKDVELEKVTHQAEKKRERKNGYRITVRGSLPGDITQRISALHAAAILKGYEKTTRESEAFVETEGSGQWTKKGTEPSLHQTDSAER